MPRPALLVLCLLAAAGARAQQAPELGDIRLPPGFHIALFARVPGARSLAVAPNGTVFVGTRGSHVFQIADGGRRVQPFAPRVAWRDPNGVCLAPDGTLFVAEENRLLAFPTPDAEGGGSARTVVASGRLVPEAEQSGTHGARYCRVGPDGRLYVALGEPYNVPPKSKMALYRQWGIGGIIRMNADGTGREVYASGIRNSVGLDFDPHTGELWFTDNQVDGMGDDQPPGELNHATGPGQNFGFPWYGGGHTRTRDYADETPPAGAVFPVVDEIAHAADLGMRFYGGPMFPARYQGAIFSAQHGSWNRSVPVGARVMVTFPKPDGTAAPSEPFAEGWLDARTGRYRGRPVDVAQLPDGSLLVSDDNAGAIDRITYDAGR